MLIKAISYMGVYCQHCGRLHIYDIPFFAGAQSLKLVCPHCGQCTAVVSYESRTTVRLSLPCSICGREHSSVYQKRLLPRVHLDRIYCYHDNFELGYIGWRSAIEAMLDSSQKAFEALHPGEDRDMVARQQQMLETINILHDMASSRKLTCRCGNTDMLVDIQGCNIILECSSCGRMAVVDTADVDEVEELAECRRLAFRRVLRKRARLIPHTSE